MTTKSIIKGAGELAKLIGQTNLIPSTVTLTKIIREVGNKNSKLDPEALLALHNLTVKTRDMSGGLSESLESSLNQIYERNHTAMLELLNSIDQLKSVDGPTKGRIMTTALHETGSIRKKEIEGQNQVATITAATIGVVVTVTAATIGWGMARPRTFWEIVTGR